MASGHYGVALRQIHRLFNVGNLAGLSDGQLLERFLATRDETAELAFTVLVERHGPMVLRICRRLLAQPHDAEDAFQATFLVLVRRAGVIRKQESVGSWLHGVAYRVATCARAASGRRRVHERRRAEMAALELAMASEPDLGPALHEEVGRLPERYRAPVVLCDLEGLSYEEAAQQLGWPLGTVKSRLARGRQRLRECLARRGLAPTAGLLGVSLALDSQAEAASGSATATATTSAFATASSAVPRGLLDATVRAAMHYAAGKAAAAGTVSASVAALTEGVLKAMFVTKLKTAVLAIGLVGTGAGVWASTEMASPPDGPQDAASAAPASASRSDSDRLADLEGKFDALLKALGSSERKPDAGRSATSAKVVGEVQPPQPAQAGNPMPSLWWTVGQPNQGNPTNQPNQAPAFGLWHDQGSNLTYTLNPMHPFIYQNQFSSRGDGASVPESGGFGQASGTGTAPTSGTIDFLPFLLQPDAFAFIEAPRTDNAGDNDDAKPDSKPQTLEQRGERLRKMVEQCLKAGPVRVTCAGEVEISVRIKDASKIDQAWPVLEQMLKQGKVAVTLDHQALFQNTPHAFWGNNPYGAKQQGQFWNPGNNTWFYYGQQAGQNPFMPGNKPSKPETANPTKPGAKVESPQDLSERMSRLERKVDQLLNALGRDRSGSSDDPRR